MMISVSELLEIFFRGRKNPINPSSEMAGSVPFLILASTEQYSCEEAVEFKSPR